MSADIARYVANLRKDLPDIRAYEEDDWTWADDGLDQLELGEYELAERTFQSLVLSQPNHFDGFEGLALVYEALGKKAKAVMMITEAFRLARLFYEDKDLDAEVMEEIFQEQRRILAMPDQPVAPDPEM
jgi:tetratricopeptide (TPR) repeat protein